MAIVEEEFGGGYGRPPRNRDRPRGKRPTPSAPLSPWDEVAKSDPYSIPGTHSYRPPTGGGGRPQYDPASLSKLTPYAMPLPVRDDPRVETAKTLPDQQRQQEANPWANGFASPTWDNPEAWQSDALTEDVNGRPTLDTGLPKTKERTRRSYEMSWDEYLALNDEQRAAVDFNTLLIQAREKDLNTEYKASEEQREAYEAEVREIFGEGRGSDTFAPETLGVLKQIDFQATDEDLDDFLGLKTTISLNELKNFEAEPVQQSVLYRDGDAQATNAYVGEAQLAVRTRDLAAALARGSEMLQTFQASAAMARNDVVQRFGGTANEIRAGFGFGAQDMRPKDREGIDEYFQSAYETLAWKDPKNDDKHVAGAWQLIRDKLTRPGDLEAFVRYADLRSQQAQQYGVPLGDGQGYRTPEEFRKMLGLDKGD